MTPSRLLGLALAGLLAVNTGLVVSSRQDVARAGVRSQDLAISADEDDAAVLTRTIRTEDGRGTRLVAVTDEDAGPLQIERDGASASGPLGPQTAASGSSFKRRYDAQYDAKQVRGQPATYHWALLIGITDYKSPAPDTYTGRQDQQTMYEHLRSLGWRSDHIMFLKDKRATAKNILRGLRWLASKTTANSTVVFAYSGHERPLRTREDGDNERRDVALWAADNRLVVDGDLGRALGKVQAKKMWIHLATCRAGGFDDKGMVKKGRVITYSSRESEYSYEDPARDHSVMGYYVVRKGLVKKKGDRNGDGRVTIEEAFRYARPRIEARTSERQHPSIVDRYDGSFTLRIPPKPRPRQKPTGSPSPACVVLC